MLLFQRQETRRKDSAGLSSHTNIARIMYQNITTIYAYVFIVQPLSRSSLKPIHTAISQCYFLLKTVHASTHLLIMPINGTKGQWTLAFFRKTQKIKQIASHQELIIVGLFLIKTICNCKQSECNESINPSYRTNVVKELRKAQKT